MMISFIKLKLRAVILLWPFPYLTYLLHQSLSYQRWWIFINELFSRNLVIPTKSFVAICWFIYLLSCVNSHLFCWCCQWLNFLTGKIDFHWWFTAISFIFKEFFKANIAIFSSWWCLKGSYGYSEMNKLDSVNFRINVWDSDNSILFEGSFTVRLRRISWNDSER